MPGPHFLVTHDEDCQAGLVIRGAYREFVRAVDTRPRFALAWADAEPRGLIVGSLHLRDSWAADAAALAAQLAEFGAALRRMRSLSGGVVEVALGGRWLEHRQEILILKDPSAIVLADFRREHGLDMKAAGEHTCAGRQPTPLTRSWTTGPRLDLGRAPSSGPGASCR